MSNYHIMRYLLALISEVKYFAIGFLLFSNSIYYF